MTKVIGVRFRTAGKIYFFDPLQFEIKRGDHVIVETARGIEFGTVMAGIMDVEDEKVVQPLKPVLRIANQRDLEQAAANKEKEKEAFKICLEKIKEHGLEMKLIDAEYTFDNNKVLFYFTADGRIDFRELVKDLAGVFKTRIELRQIGVRDETKIVGGIGICGRPLCCHSYLADFVPVSIKMAKEQNLSLNPTKISGVCGRLMCCLKNEEETYEELNRRLPGIGDQVTTEDGLRGQVQSVNVLRQLVKVVVEEGDEKEIKEYPVGKLQFRRRHGKKEKLDISKEELQELARLEEEDQQELQESAKQEGSAKRDGNRQKENGRQGGRDRQEGSQRQGNRSRQYGEGQIREEGSRRQYGNGQTQEEGSRRQYGESQVREEGSTGLGNTWERGRGRDGGRNRQHGNGQTQEEGRAGLGNTWERGRGRDGGRSRQNRWNQEEMQDWGNARERQGSRNYQDGEGREEDRSRENDREYEGRRNRQGARNRQDREIREENRPQDGIRNTEEGRVHQNGRNHQDYKGYQGNRNRPGSRERQNQKEIAGARGNEAGSGEGQQMETGPELTGQAARQSGIPEGEQRQRGGRSFRGKSRHFRPRGDRPGQEGTGQDGSR